MKRCKVSFVILGIISIGLFASISPLRSAELQNVSVSLISENLSIQPGAPFWVAVHQEIKKDWHTYWMNPGDSGMPTSLEWRLPDGFSADPMLWPAPSRFDTPPLASYGYKDEVIFLTKITPPKVFRSSEAVRIEAQVSWLECKEECLPGEAVVQTKLPVEIDTPRPDSRYLDFFSRARFSLPLEHADWTVSAFLSDQVVKIAIRPISSEAPSLGKVSFFPDRAGLIEYSAPQKSVYKNSTYYLEIKRPENVEENISQLTGVLGASRGWRGTGSEVGLSVDIPFTNDFETPSPAPFAIFQTSFWLAAGLAFLGGMLLNLMPCVLPVLSIKIFGLIRHSGMGFRDRLAHSLLYAAGILSSFWVLAGVLLLLRAGGEAVGWGFQLQSPVFVALMAVFLFVLALNFFGVFEIGTGLTRVDTSKWKQASSLGSFMTGVLATVVATPCTAPFMGSAMGYALTVSNFEALAVFTMLALGLAVPYVLFATQPVLLKLLPKPGPWMIWLKKILGLLLLATVVWLIWVFVQQTGTSASDQDTRVSWESYTDETLAARRQEGRPVFINFTAAWCLTCQVNERVVFSRNDVKAAFINKNVALLKADWTSRNTAISQALERYGRNGVPTYILYEGGMDAQFRVLPEVLTPGFMRKTLNDL